MLATSLPPTRMVRSFPWAALVVAVLTIEVVPSLHMKRGASLVIYCRALHFLLFLLATGVDR
jgi:hypothetical protein